VGARAVDLVHARLYARAFEADARAHRIDGVVARDHRDLGAAPRLARRGPDLHDLLLDLGHFDSEQRLHEQRVGARQNEARSFGGLLDALQHRPDRVALVVMLAMVLLAVGDDRLRFAELVEHYHDLAALDLLHLSRKQLADLAGELVADAAALALAHALDDALLRRLHGGTSELGERHFFLEHVAGLEVGVFEARLLERDLRARVLHRFDYRLQHHDPDRALELVDRDLGADVRAVALHQ